MPATTNADTFAPWGRRVLAAVLDLFWALPGAVIFAIALWLQSQTRGTPALRVVVMQIGLTFMFGGFGFTRWYLGSKGQSWGKLRTGLHLVGAGTHESLELVPLVLRDAAHLLDVLPAGLGFLLPLFDAERITLADKVMKTRVLQRG